MTEQFIRRSPSPARSLWRVFAAPIVITVVSLIGLIAALVGDGVMDVVSWVALGLPVAISAWFYRGK